MKTKLIENASLIVSERDAQIFFEAITNTNNPSKILKKAKDDYMVFITNPNQKR